MEDSEKIIQGLGIPLGATFTIIFALMAISFPLGAYLVFDTDMGEELTYQIPIGQDKFWLENYLDFLNDVTLGNVFILFWIMSLLLFTIGIFGPKKNFFTLISTLVTKGKISLESNYLFSVLSWFSILLLSSAIIVYVQSFFEISTDPPAYENDLVQFFQISVSPIMEEIGFRVILVGIPIFLFFSLRHSPKHFVKTLWHPFSNVSFHNYLVIGTIIVGMGVLFGISHVIFGEGWTSGKIAQASIGGIILGWVYFRYGLVSSVLIHWGTNYFIYTYGNLVAEINDISLQTSFMSSMMNALEIIFVISGLMSLALVLYTRYISATSFKIN